MGRFGEVKDFINNRLKDYPQLKHENVKGAAPQLRLFDEAGEEADVVNIAGWKVDQIEDFVREKLSA